MNSHSPDSLVGQTFDCVLGGFVPRISFRPNAEVRVQAQLGDIEIDQTVTAEIAAVRPGVFVVAWVEDNGNFIVQVQDHEAGVVHNHARLADGQVFRAEGELRRVAA